MTVALPAKKAQNAEPYYIDSGGVVTGSLGGVDQRINRLGDRWGASYTLAPMKGEVARVWIARLVRGAREKASYYFPQPGVSFPTPIAAIAQNAVANAEYISLTAGTYREGMFFSVLHDGRQWIYQIMNDSDGLVQVQPPLRSSLTAGDVVKLRDATIEGFVKGDQRRWNIDTAKIYGISFTIDEAQ